MSPRPAELPRWMRKKFESYGDDSDSIRAFGLDVVELRLERVEERDDGRAGRHAVLVVFLEFDEVEVVAAVRHGGGAVEGFLGDREEREAGREGEGLLRTGDEHVDAEFVFLDRQRAERAHGVDDGDDVRELADDGHDRGKIAHATARSLVVDEREGIVGTGGEFLADGLGIDGLTPFEFERGGLFAAAEGDVIPLVGEGAVHAVEHLLFDDVAEGALPHAPRAAGGQIDRVLGVAESLEVGLDRIVERDEIGAAMTDHRLRHGAQRFFRDGDGAGDEEFVAHNGGRVAAPKTVYAPEAVNLHRGYVRHQEPREISMPLHWLKKKFRAFELYTVDIVLGRRADAGATVYGAFLQALSWLFSGIVQTRLWLYRHRVLHDHPLGCLVVVVGNLTVGGAGKTPTVIAAVRCLQAAGRSPGVISRGYGRQADAPSVLEVQPDSPAARVGDEPLLLRLRLKVPVFVGADRVAVASALLRSHPGVDVLVSDDGLQHYAMPRALEIVMLDGERLLGNGLCLPAGPLREPAVRLEEVDYVVVNGDSTDTVLASGRYGRKPAMHLRPAAWVNLRSGARVDLHSLPLAGAGRLHAFAGIGNPQRFFATVRSLGYSPLCHPFPDHYRFGAQDLRFASGNTVVMTQKDAVKCESFAGADYWYLAVEAELDSDFSAHLLQDISARIAAATHSD